MKDSFLCRSEIFEQKCDFWTKNDFKKKIFRIFYVLVTQNKAMSRVLGPPSEEDIEAMKVKKKAAEEAQYDRQVERQSTLEETLPEGTDSGLIELALALLKYSPRSRATPVQAMKSPFFDPIHEKDQTIKLPNGKVVHMDLIRLSEEEESKLTTCL